MKNTILILLLIVAIVAGYYYESTQTSWPNLTTIAASDHTVTVAKQTLSAAQIDTILCGAKSPACHTGSSLYQDAISTGIDDAYALAVFKAESSYGTAGVAVVTRSLGNIRCTNGYDCYQGYRAYASWEAGFNDWFRLIKSLYVTSWKLTTVRTIAAKYAPASENNTSSYAASINDTMSQLSK